MPLCKKTEAELAPGGAIKNGAIYLLIQAAFRAYQIPQYTLYIQHGSYSTQDMASFTWFLPHIWGFGLWSEMHLLHVFGVSTF